MLLNLYIPPLTKCYSLHNVFSDIGTGLKIPCLPKGGHMFNAIIY